jgi:putative transposase
LRFSACDDAERSSDAQVSLAFSVDTWHTIYMKRDEIRRANPAVYPVNYQLVWIPKRRKQVLVGAVADRLREICVEVAQEHGWTILNRAIKPDHIHRFVEATTKAAPHEIGRAFKGRCSRMLRPEFPHRLKLPSLWTHRYFCRTAGKVSAAVIEPYIQGQRGT